MNSRRKRQGVKRRRISKSSMRVRKRIENNSPDLEPNYFGGVENFPGNRRRSGNSDRSHIPECHRLKKDVDCLIISKKRKRNLTELKENGTGAKNKQKRVPLPMKLRAFPQSFWQQPNRTPAVSPGNVYCMSYPLSKEESSPETRDPLEEVQLQKGREVVSEPNIDLLFSLFRSVDQEQRKISVARRGRPKKLKSKSKVIRDDDPYLTSSAAESLLPLLPARNSAESLQTKIADDEQILAMISIDGSSSFLTSLSSPNQNYSQILSELVVQL